MGSVPLCPKAWAARVPHCRNSTWWGWGTPRSSHGDSRAKPKADVAIRTWVRVEGHSLQPYGVPHCSDACRPSGHVAAVPVPIPPTPSPHPPLPSGEVPACPCGEGECSAVLQERGCCLHADEK